MEVNTQPEEEYVAKYESEYINCCKFTEKMKNNFA